MSEQFIGQITIMAFPNPPRGWAQCNGQLLPIGQNQALFALLGTQFGGNGTTTFGLPDLRGRVPIGQGTGGGQSYFIGQMAGEEQHVLTVAEMPQHNHLINTNTSVAATDNSTLPTSTSVLGQSTGFSAGNPFPVNMYASTLANTATLAPQAIANAGGNQGHENRQPYLALNICIALQGVFPSRG